MTVKVAEHLPALLRRFAGDEVKVLALAEIPARLQLETYNENRLTKVRLCWLCL